MTEEANGDLTKAAELLREKGLAAAANKAGRIATEGVVESWTPDEDAALMTDLLAVNDRLVREKHLGPAARLGPKRSRNLGDRYSL